MLQVVSQGQTVGVNVADTVRARNEANSLGSGEAGITNMFDFNRDKKVDGTDETIDQNNQGKILQLITV